MDLRKKMFTMSMDEGNKTQSADQHIHISKLESYIDTV